MWEFEIQTVRPNQVITVYVFVFHRRELLRSFSSGRKRLSSLFEFMPQACWLVLWRTKTLQPTTERRTLFWSVGDIGYVSVLTFSLMQILRDYYTK